MRTSPEQLEKARQAHSANRMRLLDPAKIRGRRFQLGVSEQALATAVGVEPGVIRRIERGHYQNDMPVGFVVTIAQVLGCQVMDLLAEEYRPRRADIAAGRSDAATLGTIASKQAGEPIDLDRAAELLGWSLPRALAALDALENALTAAPQSLAWVGPSEFLIAAPDDPTGIAEAMADETTANAGLNRLALTRLADIAAGKFNIKSSKDSRDRNVTVCWLVRAGFVSTAAEGSWYEASAVQLTDRARYDLCLDA